MPIAKLDRTILRFTGDNVKPWLDGLITNNLESPLTFAALLTPQGKIIADFFITQMDDDLLLDTPSKFTAPLLKRLKMYKLREKIEITDVTQSYHIYVLWDGEGELGEVDPRHEKLGYRLITRNIIETTHSEEDYDAHRLALSIPDSHYDFETQTTFPANANMDIINGVDFKKGCFVGQEVVSMMKRKTEVKKRMRAVTSEQFLELGPIHAGERIVGEVLYTSGTHGMAMIRLDRLADAKELPKSGAFNIQIIDLDV